MDENSELGSYWQTPSGAVYQLLAIYRDSKGGLVFSAERCTETGESFYEGPTETAIGVWQGRDHGMKPFIPAPKLNPGLILADKDGHTQAFLLEYKRGDGMLWRLLDDLTLASRERWEEVGYTNFRQLRKSGGGRLDVTLD